jgi:putative glycosyltransferase (TIGR04372 family)
MAELFRKSDVPRDRLHHAIGRVPERPFQILGLTSEVTLGDLIANTVFFSTLANQFDHARLHVKFRDVRPYSRDVLSLSPWIDKAEALPGEWPKLVRAWAPHLKPWKPMDIGKQKGRNVPFYDLIVSNQMASVNAVHALPSPVTLSLPSDRAAALRNRLVELGLRPERWFAVIHSRESTYQFRPRGGDRDNDPAAFESLARHVVSLGGHIVRLGHPGMSALPAMEGLVDLSNVPDGFLLQAAAVSRARFMVAGPSGAIALAWAFGVPNALVDAVDAGGMWGEEYGSILTHEVITPSSKCLRNESLLASGLLDRVKLQAKMKSEAGYRMRKMSADEAKTVATRLYEKTANCSGWRELRQTPSRPKPNTIQWPPVTTHPTPWLDL